MSINDIGPYTSKIIDYAVEKLKNLENKDEILSNISAPIENKMYKKFRKYFIMFTVYNVFILMIIIYIAIRV